MSAMNISATKVNELRKLTGVGMMECKRALERSQGDMDGAVEELRKLGIAKAGKIAGRIAAEGIVVISDTGAMVEVNCQTDFVAREADFIEFAKKVANTASHHRIQDIDTLSQSSLLDSTQTIEEARQGLITKLGENIQVRRAVVPEAQAEYIGTYTHGYRIGVVVVLDVENKELARDVAMHIAASKPLVIYPEDVSADIVAKEKEIYAAQAATSGKPQEIIEKMVMGRLKKYLDEVSLMGQPFVKDPEMTVAALLNKHRAKVINFYRFEVGEGIEKVTEDFKEAVLSQMKESGEKR